jgi:hypothetical protein
MNKDVYISRKEAANLIGVRHQTLACWAFYDRYDLPYYKIGKKVVKYKLHEVEEFINKHKHVKGRRSYNEKI